MSQLKRLHINKKILEKLKLIMRHKIIVPMIVTFCSFILPD